MLQFLFKGVSWLGGMATSWRCRKELERPNCSLLTGGEPWSDRLGKELRKLNPTNSHGEETDARSKEGRGPEGKMRLLSLQRIS